MIIAVGPPSEIFNHPFPMKQPTAPVGLFHMMTLAGQIMQLESGLASVSTSRRDVETEEPETLCRQRGSFSWKEAVLSALAGCAQGPKLRSLARVMVSP